MIRKKMTRATSYERRIQQLTERYKKEMGTEELDINQFVLWAEQHGEFKPTVSQMRKKFARDTARALSRDQFENEDGEPVRRQQCYRTQTQLTLWKAIDKCTPDEMRISYQVTRRQAGGVVFQKQRDIDWYNKHVNPGDPIQTSWDFDRDMEDRKMPTEYPEGPEA